MLLPPEEMLTAANLHPSTQTALSCREHEDIKQPLLEQRKQEKRPQTVKLNDQMMTLVMRRQMLGFPVEVRRLQSVRWVNEEKISSSCFTQLLILQTDTTEKSQNTLLTWKHSRKH